MPPGQQCQGCVVQNLEPARSKLTWSPIPIQEVLCPKIQNARKKLNLKLKNSRQSIRPSIEDNPVVHGEVKPANHRPAGRHWRVAVRRRHWDDLVFIVVAYWLWLGWFSVTPCNDVNESYAPKRTFQHLGCRCYCPPPPLNATMWLVSLWSVSCLRTQRYHMHNFFL